MHATGPVHLLLVGAPGTEFRTAAAMAREAGAHVTLADCAAMALQILRDDGGDIVMIDIDQDVARSAGSRGSRSPRTVPWRTRLRVGCRYSRPMIDGPLCGLQLSFASG